MTGKGRVGSSGMGPRRTVRERGNSVHRHSRIGVPRLRNGIVVQGWCIAGGQVAVIEHEALSGRFGIPIRLVVAHQPQLGQLAPLVHPEDDVLVDLHHHLPDQIRAPYGVDLPHIGPGLSEVHLELESNIVENQLSVLGMLEVQFDGSPLSGGNRRIVERCLLRNIFVERQQSFGLDEVSPVVAPHPLIDGIRC